MARTASRLPFIAASTTALPPGGVAADSITASGTAANAPSMQMLISVLRIVETQSAITKSSINQQSAIDLALRVREHDWRVVQIELTGAVAEALEIGASEHVQHRQHRVGHRRAVRRLDVDAALQLAAGVPGDEQRHALVVVDVRVAHRRSVDDQAVVEQRGITLAGVLQLLEQIRNHAHVVAVDLRELQD